MVFCCIILSKQQQQKQQQLKRLSALEAEQSNKSNIKQHQQRQKQNDETTTKFEALRGACGNNFYLLLPHACRAPNNA